MNKAFVREPDSSGDAHCPQCGSLGIAVTESTLAARLSPEGRRQVAESAWFCPFPKCAVSYFDQFERSVTAEFLLQPVWPKDPAAPVCACHALTAAEIAADAAAGRPERVRRILAEARDGRTDCAARSPTGRPCTAELQRLFMRDWKPAS